MTRDRRDGMSVWLIIVSGLFFLFAAFGGDLSAKAAVYKWKDKRGSVHITDDWNDVPDYARLEIVKRRPGATIPEDGRRDAAVRASAARRGESRGRPATAGREAIRFSTVAERGGGRDFVPSRIVVLDADGIRVPPDGKENRAFWENLVQSWRKQMEEAKEALEGARKEEQVRARIRQYIPLRVHTDAMIEAQKKAAKLEARMAQVRRVLEETIPRLAREADANLSWIK